MVQALVSQSPDIQKVLAFEGAFEKLFNTVTQEGGVDGGVVAQGALSCVDALLRFNNSNQVRSSRTSNAFLTPANNQRRVTSEKPPCRLCYAPYFNSRLL